SLPRSTLFPYTTLFRSRGDDLHCTMEVPMTAAALGTVLELETLDGVEQVDIRPGTQPGEVVTLRDLGVGHLRGGGRGDLHVQIRSEEHTSELQSRFDLV